MAESFGNGNCATSVRRDPARELNQDLISRTEAKVCDRLADIPELSRHACFAADGYWHKAAQALLNAITHNLLLGYEQDLERRYEVSNVAEDQRRSRRIQCQ